MSNSAAVDHSIAPTSPIDESTKNRLESLLVNRSDKAELQDKGIIYASKLDPALQSAEKELAKQQVANKLGQALKKRPDAEELVEEGILKKDEVPV